jgi:hypothetical protein
MNVLVLSISDTPLGFDVFFDVLLETAPIVEI